MQQPPAVRLPKTTAITDDFEISNTVLGLGINGKVVKCSSRQTGQTYALKVCAIVLLQQSPNYCLINRNDFHKSGNLITVYIHLIECMLHLSFLSLGCLMVDTKYVISFISFIIDFGINIYKTPNANCLSLSYTRQLL